jgi:ABC-2 type transport system ATP-binding protein
MIKVEGLTKRYARTVAVDNISFEVQKGQIVGFLGRNGAGKTTTMRVLTCFLPPTAGSATVAGFDVQKHPMEVKKRIGYLPETPPLYPEMEVHEYLDFVARIKGVPSGDVKKRVDEAMGKCALGDVKMKLISKLSKGYRQRVGLAQAILHNPDVLILDEPTAGLDPQQIIETRDLIKGLAGEHTIILSTHILSEVEQTCKQVMIIARGKLIATDSMDNLIHPEGVEMVAVEVMPRGGGATDAAAAQKVQQALEKVSGVSSVVHRDTLDGKLMFSVQGLHGRQIRPEVARAVIDAGWDLNELHAVGSRLEEIFLRLTAAVEGVKEAKPEEVKPEEVKASEAEPVEPAGESK